MDEKHEQPELKTPADLGKIFIGSVPRPVMAFIGTLVAAALAFELVITVGGFHGPMLKVANAYAQRMETTALSVQASSKVLEEQVQILKTLAGRLEQIEKSDTAQSNVLKDHDRRITVLERSNRPR